METLSRLSTEDRENLSAYLDGELDDKGTQRIESLLVQSSVARNDVELLSKTYDLLDELPRPNAPNDFLEKTLATAKLEQVKNPISEQQWFITGQQVLILTGWTLAMVVASVIGFWLTNQFVERPDDALVEELPLIQNLDRYEEVQSMEFLNLLTADEKLLNEMKQATSHEQK